jgi:hypothetical protein
MRLLKLATATALIAAFASVAIAGEEYNTVPVSDPQYGQCLAYTLTKYEGGAEKSPIRGQTKAEAFCTCMWNETPDDFRGNLAKFSETEKGAKTNKICEKYSDWS